MTLECIRHEIHRLHASGKLDDDNFQEALAVVEHKEAMADHVCDVCDLPVDICSCLNQ